MNSHSGADSDSDYDSFDSCESHSGRESQPKAKKTKKTRGMTVMKEVINWVNKGNPKYIVRYLLINFVTYF